MELKDLVGKKIIKIEANGFMVEIITEDGILFEYDATDGGYSRYKITKLRKNDKRLKILERVNEE